MFCWNTLNNVLSENVLPLIENSNVIQSSVTGGFRRDSSRAFSEVSVGFKIERIIDEFNLFTFQLNGCIMYLCPWYNIDWRARLVRELIVFCTFSYLITPGEFLLLWSSVNWLCENMVKTHYKITQLFTFSLDSETKLSKFPMLR